MYAMNIAIIGSSGYIGSQLINFIQPKCNSVIKINRSKVFDSFILDLEHPQIFDYNILSRCDFVIFTAAISSPDYCAKEYEHANNVNVIGTKYFIQQALKHDCKVLFFSSDAVFGNDAGIQFNEKSKTSANTAYGIMKKEIEDSFKENKLFKAIRLSYVISQNDKFTKYIVECQKSDIIADVFHPFYRNCIAITDVIDSVIWLIRNWNEFESPFLNICGSELVSKVRIVDEFNRISKTKVNYRIIQPSNDFFYNRPQITEMNSIYIDRVLKNCNEPFSVKMNKQFSK